MQVHTVETGDHSLKAKGGKQAAALAVAEAIEAAVSFAKQAADAASAANDTHDEPPQQAVGSAPAKRKARTDAKATSNKSTEPRTTKKRQRKHDST